MVRLGTGDDNPLLVGTYPNDASFFLRTGCRQHVFIKRQRRIRVRRRARDVDAIGSRNRRLQRKPVYRRPYVLCSLRYVSVDGQCNH